VTPSKYLIENVKKRVLIDYALNREDNRGGMKTKQQFYPHCSFCIADVSSIRNRMMKGTPVFLQRFLQRFHHATASAPDLHRDLPQSLQIVSIT
jgi:hypothetical protein